MGKPDYEWAQVEEYRTKLDEDLLDKLRSESESEVEDVKETIATNLKRPGVYSSDNFHIAYIGMTNDVRGKLTRSDRVKLIDAANKADVDAFVTPPISDPSTEEAEEIIYSQIDYGQRALESEMFVIPTLDLTSMTPHWVEQVSEHIKEVYSEEEVPIVATDGFYPVKNSTEFLELREALDRLVMVSSCRKKPYYDEIGEEGDLERVSAEVLLAGMGADIIGQYFHTGGFSPEEEDQKVTEMGMDMMEGNSMVYRDNITLEDADVISCNCLIHSNMDDDQAIKYFGSQNKLMAAEGIHNEMRVPQAVDNLREYLRNDNFTEFRNQFEYMDEALDVVLGEEE